MRLFNSDSDEENMKMMIQMTTMMVMVMVTMTMYSCIPFLFTCVQFIHLSVFLYCHIMPLPLICHLLFTAIPPRCLFVALYHSTLYRYLHFYWNVNCIFMALHLHSDSQHNDNKVVSNLIEFNDGNNDVDGTKSLPKYKVYHQCVSFFEDPSYQALLLYIYTTTQCKRQGFWHTSALNHTIDSILV